MVSKSSATQNRTSGRKRRRSASISASMVTAGVATVALTGLNLMMMGPHCISSHRLET